VDRSFERRSRSSSRSCSSRRGRKRSRSRDRSRGTSRGTSRERSRGRSRTRRRKGPSRWDELPPNNNNKRGRYDRRDSQKVFKGINGQPHPANRRYRGKNYDPNFRYRQNNNNNNKNRPEQRRARDSRNTPPFGPRGHTVVTHGKGHLGRGDGHPRGKRSNQFNRGIPAQQKNASTPVFPAENGWQLPPRGTQQQATATSVGLVQNPMPQQQQQQQQQQASATLLNGLLALVLQQHQPQLSQLQQSPQIQGGTLQSIFGAVPQFGAQPIVPAPRPATLVPSHDSSETRHFSNRTDSRAQVSSSAQKKNRRKIPRKKKRSHKATVSKPLPPHANDEKRRKRVRIVKPANSAAPVSISTPKGRDLVSVNMDKATYNAFLKFENAMHN